MGEFVCMYAHEMATAISDSRVSGHIIDLSILWKRLQPIRDLRESLNTPLSSRQFYRGRWTEANRKYPFCMSRYVWARDLWCGVLWLWGVHGVLISLSVKGMLQIDNAASAA